MVESAHSPKIKPKNDPINRLQSSSTSSDSLCGVHLDRERLEEILSNIPSAVLVVEKPNGKIIYANKRAVELHGVNPCGTELKDFSSTLKIYTMEGKLCPTEQLLTYAALVKGETVRGEPSIIERQDGERYIVNVSAKPICDKDGNVNGAITIYDDITERRLTEEELRESEERLNLAQRIAHVGNWEYYVKQDKAVWSNELFNIFGLPPKPYGPTAQEYMAFVHPEDKKEVEQKVLFSRTAPTVSFDYRIIRSDGAVRFIHTERRVREAAPDKSPIRVVGVEQDITERKQIELELQAYTKDLERIVEERTRQLKDAERLAAIGQTAGMIGHDLRNPLQTIAGELFLMKQDVDASPDSSCKTGVQESLGTIQQQVDYMHKIVSDLQDFARPLKPELVQVDLQEAIPELLSTVDIPDNVEAQMVCQRELPKVPLDLTFMKRILVNLAINAIQAMPNGGKLTVRCMRQNGGVVISVGDTGVGIPEDIKLKIFQPLMTTKAKGQGFGLAVVKRLVEAQGGAITFESKAGEGTQFKITFPK